MKYEHDIGSWTCMDTSHDEQFLFGNVSDFKNHMHEYHSGQFDEDDLKDLADACFQSRTMNVTLEKCPFCHEDEDLELSPGGLIRHVAQHLLEFARISLEGYNEEENEQSDEYSSIDQMGNSSNQFVSDTITDGLRTDFRGGEDDDLESLDAPEIAEQPPDTENTVWESYLKTDQKSEENTANDPVLRPFISRLNSNLDSSFRTEVPSNIIPTSLFPETVHSARYTMSGEFRRFCEDVFVQLSLRLGRRDDDRCRFAPVGTAKQVLRHDVLLRFFRTLGFPVAIWMEFRSNLEEELIRRLDERGLYEFLAILIFSQCRLEAARTFTTKVLGKDPWPSDICSLPANREGLMTLFGDSNTSDRFLACQACFCPVVIHMGTEGHVDSQDLTRLPYLNEQLIAQGAFGKVYRVEIAKGHFYDNRMGARNQHPIVLARKDYTVGKELHAKFNTEMLRTSVLVCQNVIQTLASLRIGSDIYSIFMPLAICDLWEYMTEYRPLRSSTTAEKAEKIFCLKGVASGLNFLHNELVTAGGERLICYHMDLKPSNILIFREDNKETWKVGGFSVAHIVSQKKEDTREEGRRFSTWKSFRHRGSDRESSPERAENRRGEGTYSPPESLASFPSMSTRSDVWSLGCVISVIFAYLEEGASGVTRYSDRRANERESDGMDLFFIRDKGLKFKAHPGVNRWHHDLIQKATARNRQEGAIVRSILDFLERSVFVDERNRCEARKVEQMLQETSTRYGELESLPTEVLEDVQPTLEERIKGRLPGWLRSRKE